MFRAESVSKIKFGMMVPQGCLLDLPNDLDSHSQYKYSVESAKQIENLGYDSLWVGDHFYPLRGAPKKALIDAFLLLSALAGETSKIGLGTMVICNSFRHPSLMAKMSATLDVISGGRLEFGIGAGGMEEEYLAYGFPYPKPSVRVGMLSEAVRIVKRMWTEEKASFSGKYYKISEAICDPKPLQKPYPPIIIGGGGEQLTLRVLARYGDKCNFHSGIGVEGLRRKLEVLKNHCSSVGRNYEEIGKTCRVDVIFADNTVDAERILQEVRGTGRPINPDRVLIGDVKHCVEKLREIANLGFTYFILSLPQFTEQNLKTFAQEVMPRVNNS